MVEAEAATLRPMIRMRRLVQLLGVSRGTIYNWIETNAFPPPINMGDNTMAFYEDEVAEWQKKKEAQSSAPPHIRRLKTITPRS